MDNRLGKDIPTDIMAKCIEKAQETLTLFSPYSVAITDDERASLLKAGVKTLAFIKKTREIVLAHPEYLPAFVKVEDFKTDVSNIEKLEEILSPTSELHTNLLNALMVACSEAYQAALLIYHILQLAAKEAGTAEARQLARELRDLLPTNANKKKHGKTDTGTDPEESGE